MRLNWRASVKRVLARRSSGRRRDRRACRARKRSLAVAAVDERVGEVRQVAGRLPHRGRRQDGGVEADDVVAQLHHRPPPGVLHVAQHQHAERAVVVGGAEAAVDLGRREHEAAPLGEVDDLVEQPASLVGGGRQALGHWWPGHEADRTGIVPPAPSAIHGADHPIRAARLSVGCDGDRGSVRDARADPTDVMGQRIAAYVIDSLIALVIVWPSRLPVFFAEVDRVSTIRPNYCTELQQHRKGVLRRLRRYGLHA